MFDVSFWELVVIGIVALIVIGPEQLPAVATKLGRWIGRARRFVTNVRTDIEREIRQEEIRKAIENDASLDEIKKIINDTRFTIEDEPVQQPPVVKAIPDASVSQAEMLKAQEHDLSEDTYGLTDHRDYGSEMDETHSETTSRSDTPPATEHHNPAVAHERIENKAGG